MSYRPAAVVVPCRRDAFGELEIYLARRSDTLAFLGGFFSFAGGALDPVDDALAGEGLAPSASISAAHRELFEELGVLLAPELRPERDEQRRLLRAAVLEDPEHWGALVRKHGASLPALLPLGVWETPSFSTIRFKADYYAAWIDEAGEQVELWLGEHSEGLWLPVDEALTRHEEGRTPMSFPVLETLKVIKKHNSDLRAAGRELVARGPDAYVHDGGEMLAGLHMVPLRTPTLPPATHTNCYVLGRGDYVVIDPASPYEDEQRRLLNYLDFLGSRGGRVREVWLTHEHPDHVGAAETIRQRHGVPIAAHELTKAALASRLKVDRCISDGETTTFGAGSALDRWRALHTPGHARGHLCFYEERRGTLISGDLIVSSGSVVVAPPDGNMRHYFESLAKVRDLPRLSLLFPAHGPPVATPRRLTEHYIAHRQAREDSVLAQLGQPRTLDELLPAVYGDVPQALWPLAKKSLLAHVNKLIDENRLKRCPGSEKTFVKLDI